MDREQASGGDRVIAGYLILSYAFGSIPTGYWLGKAWKGLDVRRHGSGNLGATNVLRVLGKGPAMITLLIDIVKGWVPVRLMQHAAPGNFTLATAAGCLAILGHATSPFVGFRGGKGVATSAGVFIALLPVPAAIAIAVFLATLLISHIVSISSMVAVLAWAASAYFLAPARLPLGAAWGVTVLVFWTHRANIRRLLAGTEPRLERSKGPSSR